MTKKMKTYFIIWKNLLSLGRVAYVLNPKMTLHWHHIENSCFNGLGLFQLDSNELKTCFF